MREEGERVFDRLDWLAFGLAGAVVFGVYLFSMGPSVGLEDSGELITAAAGLGVPHPPGYPLWTLLSWCFCKVFGWVSWQGWPNPAWPVALASAVMGALAVGLMALLGCRTVRDLLPEARRSWALMSGVGGASLFGLSPVMWSQAVIAEVYALGAFFVALTLVLAYKWVVSPRASTLIWLGFSFGLGLTNYQTLLLAALPLGVLVLLRWRALRVWSVAAALGACALGLSVYLYLPIAARFDPAMNWGDARTWAGFVRMLGRGQYEALVPSSVFSARFWGQLWDYAGELTMGFTWPVAVLGVVGLAALAVTLVRRRRWLGTAWLGCTVCYFILMSALLVMLANPRGDLQDIFVQKVKFIASHGLFALWVGYGLAWMGVALRRWRGAGAAVALGALGVAAAPVWQNAMSDALVLRYGAAEQRGHDFGWRFGAHMLGGAPQIRAELAPDEEPLPDPFWPPPMEQGAILFGGTDPGRFVPTYLVHAVGFRRDLHVLTQNALADPTYLTPTRRLYPDLTLPTDEEQTLTTAWMVHQAGGTLGATLQVTDSRVIWQTNGALAWNIFQANPERAVYVEASQWIPWMDDHLEPAGLAMRLNRAQGDLEGLAARNADFWEWMARRLAADEAYRRDFAARRAFSSLSVSIAGLYARKGLFPEAETAFRQAFALYPTSAQVINDTVQGMLLPQYRVNEALRLVRNHRKADPGLAILERVEAQLLEVKSLWDRRAALMEQERTAPLATEETLALARLCEKLALYGADAPAAALTAQAVACRKRLAEAPDLTAAQARESFVALSERQAHEAALAMLRRVPPVLFVDFSEREAAIAGALAQTYEEVPLAKQVYEAAVARHKQSASLWLGLGLCYYYGRDGEKAYAALLRARQLDAALIDGTPGVQDVLRYLAERYGPRKGS